MKIGILGSGEVGRRLADGCIDLGHHVMIGTRNPSKEEIQQWIDNTKHKENAFIGSFSDAASFGELIIISTLWGGNSKCDKFGYSIQF